MSYFNNNLDPAYFPDTVVDMTIDDIPADQEIGSDVQTSYSSSIDEMADDDSLDVLNVEDISSQLEDPEDPPELVPDDNEFEDEDDDEDFDYEIDSDD